MHTRRGVFTLPLLLAAIPSVARATLANGDPRKERLYAMFIAPCCWRENLAVHQSPKADELRAEIDRMIQAGRSDEEIKNQFIAQHTRRILALPEGASRQWLSWTPAALIAAGLTAVALFISRSVRTTRNATTPPLDNTKLPDLPDSEWN